MASADRDALGGTARTVCAGWVRGERAGPGGGVFGNQRCCPTGRPGRLAAGLRCSYLLAATVLHGPGPARRTPGARDQPPSCGWTNRRRCHTTCRRPAARAPSRRPTLLEGDPGTVQVGMVTFRRRPSVEALPPPTRRDRSAANAPCQAPRGDAMVAPSRTAAPPTWSQRAARTAVRYSPRSSAAADGRRGRPPSRPRGGGPGLHRRLPPAATGVQQIAETAAANLLRPTSAESSRLPRTFGTRLTTSREAGSPLLQGAARALPLLGAEHLHHCSAPA